MKILEKLLRRTGQGRPTTNVTDTINRALDSAGLARGAGGVRDTIDRALSDAGLQPHADGSHASQPTGKAAAPGDGEFLHATFANEHGRRDYRLYRPVGHAQATQPMPLVMMLHGCTQSPEDFAIGTHMNALADRHGFLVAYPEQPPKDNGAKCWNWFRPEDQARGRGEPSILAGIARRIVDEEGVDRQRVFVAGLSAGAAMAVVLAHTDPDLFRAIGVHSGVPYAAAHDVPSAFAAMQGRGTRASSAASATQPPVPMIVFHGDRDHTVAIANASALIDDATRAVPHLRATQEGGKVDGGHAWTREMFADAEGRARLERWTIHGAGHAWSGGDPAGTYTDPAGPDASSEMLRFFMAQASSTVTA